MAEHVGFDHPDHPNNLRRRQVVALERIADALDAFNHNMDTLVVGVGSGWAIPVTVR